MEFENSYQQIPPHTYPIFIKCSVVFCFLALACFLLDLPHFKEVNNLSRKAELAFQRKQYDKAYKLYRDLHKQFPGTEKIKLRLAQMLFKIDNKSAHQEAMNLLSGITLNKYQWKELLCYMPSEYEELFDTVEEKT